jgi:hypothetical protein
MKKLLSVIVAVLFAATGFNAVAQQSKDVTTKGGDAVADKKAGTNVQTKEKKEKPKAAAPKKMKAKAKKEKPESQEVKTKTSGNVVDKEKKDVKTSK